MNQTLHWPIRITFVLYSRIRCSCFSWMKQVLLFCKILQGALHCGMSAALILVFLQACLQCVLWPILTSCVMCSVNTDEIHFYEWVHTVSLSHSFTAGMDFLNHLSISSISTVTKWLLKSSNQKNHHERRRLTGRFECVTDGRGHAAQKCDFHPALIFHLWLLAEKSLRNEDRVLLRITVSEETFPTEWECVSRI